MKFKNDKEGMEQLAVLMNEQSETPVFVTDELLHILDAVLEPEEVDFLLAMGGGKSVLPEIESRAASAGDRFTEIFERLLDIGIIVELEPEDGRETFHLNTIFPGFFESYLMDGRETPDRRLFSERVKALYESSSKIGDPDLINEVMRAVGPHRSIAATTPPGNHLISVGESVEPPIAEVFPPNTVLEVLGRVGEDDVITVGYCFCRQQKKMVGDPCRMHLPDESCIALGPAAEHLAKKGFARRITKDEAARIIRTAADHGAVHQIGRVLPMKDFKPKFEVDIICNCCWDCCGAIGNYNRGHVPFILKSHYIAEIPDPDACTGCGLCEDYCPVRAISLIAGGIAEIDPDMCCGCGQCALHCPEEAVCLEPSEREVFIPILDGEDVRI